MGFYEDVVKHIIDNLNIVDDQIVNDQTKNAHSIKLLLENKQVEKKDIIDWIHNKLLSVGRQSFEGYLQERSYRLSPHCLAYALYHMEFTDEERKSINYDGETEEIFIENLFSEKLPETIFSQLIVSQKEPIAS